ncbi:protein NLRC3-like [Nematostella vectensis]|uniref:protein NLRC3-like n=1 Tax=Nematostella vectensis TaxID=45351 RepID=UPI0020773DF5|nr:protein NLRC3-like [Nematostella vectensis]
MRQFIYRYFQEDPESAKSLISDLDMHPVAEDIARIPLTALLICAMWGEMPHALVLSTMTSLFVELTICLVKRHYAKMDKQAECDPEELASLQDIPRDLYDALLQLGEIAFEGLIEDQLIFDQKALEKNCSHKGIFELGFLSLEKSSSRLKPVQKCRFVHRCYQEFLAAFWLSSKIKEALTDSSVYEEVLVHGMRCVTMNKTTVLFSFTPGLLGDAFKEFLDLVIKEGSVIADSEELKQKLFTFCLQALFESQQGHLAGNLAEYAPDGVIRITEEVELSPYDIRAMAFFVHHYPGAKTLIFEDTYLSKRHLATLGRCLSEMKNLKELHFVRSFAASDAMEVFVSNLSRDLSLERLVSLRSKLLGKDFAQVIKCCPRLKSLDMVNNELGQSMEQVLIALKSCQQLQSVRFKQEIILPRFCTHLCSFVRHSRTLTNVTIENSSISSLDDLFSLLDSLLALSSKLRYLCLSDLLVLKKHIGAHQSVYSTLDNVVPSLKLLEHIDLSRNNLSNWTRMTSTFDGLKSIKHINLSANKMCDAGVGLLAKALVNLSNLEVLHLAWNEITCEGAILLADSLSGLTRLEALSLKSNKIANKGAIALFRALSGVPAIQRIFLAGNLITSAGVCGMVEHLQGMHNLRCLNLKHNLIDESGFLAVTHVIRHLPQLHQLLLGSPVIPKDQMDSGGIAQACASHYTHIFTQMSSAGFTLLMEDANSHPTLESISISMNAVPKGVDAEGLPKLKFWGHYDDQ